MNYTSLSAMMMMMNCFCGMVDWRKALALFPAGTIVRDLRHLESPTRREEDLNLRRNLSSDFVEWSCAAVLTTTPRRHNNGYYSIINYIKFEKEHDTLFEERLAFRLKSLRTSLKRVYSLGDLKLIWYLQIKIVNIISIVNTFS